MNNLQILEFDNLLDWSACRQKMERDISSDVLCVLETQSQNLCTVFSTFLCFYFLRFM